MPLYVIVAAATVGLSLSALLWTLFAGRPQHAAESNLSRGLGPTNLRELVLTRPASERAVQPFIHSLAAATRRLTPQGFIDSLERRIVLAGRPGAWPLERVLAMKLLLGSIGLAAGTFYVVGAPGLRMVVFAGAITTTGFFLPDVLLYSRAKSRQDAITLALPDTLDQMTICVQAGLGFEAALVRAGDTGRGPLADELVRTMQEMQVGSSRGEALRSLAARTEVAELRQFVLALLQAESYGLPIAKVLQTQADELRVRRRQRAEERAMKMPVKIVFPLVFCILPAMFVVVLAPAFIRAIQFFSGS